MKRNNVSAQAGQEPDFARLFDVPDQYADDHNIVYDANPSSRPWFDDLDVSYVETFSTPPQAPAPKAAAVVEDTPAQLPVVYEKRSVYDVQFHRTAPPKSTVAIHIARSMRGNMEVCLISERENGEHVRYALDIKEVYEHKQQRIPLVQQSGAPKGKGETEVQMPLVMPLGLAEAKIVFDEAVALQFPPAKLKNSDRLVPTHVALL